MKKALVLQKDPLNLELANILLNEAGFIGYNAMDSYDVINMAESHFFDLIILDTENLGMDCIELAKTIKSKPSCKDVNIVALTNNESPHDKQKILASYFDDYLSYSMGILELKERFQNY